MAFPQQNAVFATDSCERFHVDYLWGIEIPAFHDSWFHLVAFHRFLEYLQINPGFDPFAGDQTDSTGCSVESSLVHNLYYEL